MSFIVAHRCVQLNWITLISSECVLQGLVQFWWENPPQLFPVWIRSQRVIWHFPKWASPRFQVLWLNIYIFFLTKILPWTLKHSIILTTRLSPEDFILSSTRNLHACIYLSIHIKIKILAGREAECVCVASTSSLRNQLFGIEQTFPFSFWNDDNKSWSHYGCDVKFKSYKDDTVSY